MLHIENPKKPKNRLPLLRSRVFVLWLGVAKENSAVLAPTSMHGSGTKKFKNKAHNLLYGSGAGFSRKTRNTGVRFFLVIMRFDGVHLRASR
jgi:hypothetical protein